MATRADVQVIENGKPIVHIYVHWDGYPAGLGRDILDILGPSPCVVNGYGSGEDCPETFNGMGCLAAYLIGKLKLRKENTSDDPWHEAHTIGNVYIVPIHDPYEEYAYIIRPPDDDGRLLLTCRTGDGNTLYDGPLSGFAPEAVR